MVTQKDVVMDDVARFMVVAWRRRTPKLVLSIIGSAQYYQPWEKTRFKEEFEDGIIQVGLTF